jgi:hypothetical protein
VPEIFAWFSRGAEKGMNMDLDTRKWMIGKKKSLQPHEVTWLRSLQPDSRMHRFNPLGLYNILEQTFCLGFQSLPHFLGPQEFTLLQASLCSRTKEQSAVKDFNTSLEGQQLTGTRKYTRGINTKSSIHQSYKPSSYAEPMQRE